VGGYVVSASVDIAYDFFVIFFRAGKAVSRLICNLAENWILFFFDFMEVKILWEKIC